MPVERHSPAPYPCAGCGEPTACTYGEDRRPLCPECLKTLQERPELRPLVLAPAPDRPS